MVTVSALDAYRQLPPEAAALRNGFLRWQCRVRQIAARETGGRPDAAIMPTVFLDGDDAPFGQIITVLSKVPPYSVTPELMHIAKSIFDPAERRDKALAFLSASHFQKHRDFDDTLTGTFKPGSAGAKRLCDKSPVRLVFEAYNQRFDLSCAVRFLTDRHPLHQATWWHNFLFNPALRADCAILGFTPDWEESAADPTIKGGH
jgi:hypothetical protein